MPDKWPLANGNWSNAANWNGGTKPVAGDDVYADGRTVSVDESFTVATLRTTQRSGGTVGGTFVFNTAGVTGTVTNTTQALFQGAANMINITATSGNVNLSVASNISGANSLQYVINHTGLCTHTLTCLQLIATGNGSGVFQKNTVSQTTINCTSVIGGNGSGIAIVVTTGPLTVNNTGNIVGGTATNSFAISMSGSVLTINGNVLGGTAANAISTSATTNTITGNVTAGTVAAISSASANIVNVTGTATASASAPAITMTNANGQVYLNGNMVNNNGKMAIFAPIVWLDKNNTTSAAFFTSGGGNRTLYSADTVPNTPAANNVREGVAFGAGNSLTGTLKMPTAANVRNGVVYDNGTTGTALFTTSQLLTEINASSDAVAVRMKNAATPQILGEIMEAFKKA